MMMALGSLVGLYIFDAMVPATARLYRHGAAAMSALIMALFTFVCEPNILLLVLYITP